MRSTSAGLNRDFLARPAGERGESGESGERGVGEERGVEREEEDWTEEESDSRDEAVWSRESVRGASCVLKTATRACSAPGRVEFDSASI